MSRSPDDGQEQPSRIAGLLARTQAGLDRVTAEGLGAEISAGALVVDVRPVEQRRRDGELPGAVVIDRNVLEWRLDPTSPDRLPGLEVDATTRIVLVCNEGYSSSLAAATLQALGLHGATDLAGGFQALLRAWNLPPSKVDKSFLEEASCRAGEKARSERG